VILAGGDEKSSFWVAEPGEEAEFLSQLDRLGPPSGRSGASLALLQKNIEAQQQQIEELQRQLRAIMGH